MISLIFFFIVFKYHYNYTPERMLLFFIDIFTCHSYSTKTSYNEIT